jgi:hypothetical protein
MFHQIELLPGSNEFETIRPREAVHHGEASRMPPGALEADRTHFVCSKRLEIVAKTLSTKSQSRASNSRLGADLPTVVHRN